MPKVSGSELAAVAAAALLLAALLAWAALWPRAAWYFLADRDRPPAERALRDGAAAFNTTPDAYSRQTRPVVTRRPDRTCILLATAARDGDGSYRACYDPRDGTLVEERATIGF